MIYEGLVGPIVSDELLSMNVRDGDAAVPPDAAGTMVIPSDSGRTPAFTSELPLPLPLSVDEYPRGRGWRSCGTARALPARGGRVVHQVERRTRGRESASRPRSEVERGANGDSG